MIALGDPENSSVPPIEEANLIVQKPYCGGGKPHMVSTSDSWSPSTAIDFVARRGSGIFMRMQ